MRFKKLLPLLSIVFVSMIFVQLVILRHGGFPEELIIDQFLNVITVLIGLAIYWAVIMKKPETLNPNVEIKEEQINDFTTKVFSSKNFLNAFETSLPQGKDDKVYGLDYIPYMLKNTEERRSRFTSSANRFLNLTIFLGIIFIVITVWFGYILINEDEIGTQKIVKSIDSRLESINMNLAIQSPDVFNNLRFNELCQQEITDIEISRNLNSKNKEIQNRFNDVIRKIKKSNDPIQLRDSLEILTQEVSKDTPKDEEFASKVESMQSQYSLFLRDKESSYSILNTNVNRLESSISTLKRTFSEPNNRLAEILKRLILSLVVISFFVAILRYVAGLYRAHLNEMIKIEKEDLAIRKFYIALKSSANSQADKSKVIVEFLNNSASNNEGDNSRSVSKEEISIIKEVIDSILKKI